MTEPAAVTTAGLPARITYAQIVKVLGFLAPDLEPRDVQHIVISPTSVDICTYHADQPNVRTHSYRIEHQQGAATEGSNR